MFDMGLFSTNTAENKCAGKLERYTGARRDGDGRVAKWLLLRVARRNEDIAGPRAWSRITERNCNNILFIYKYMFDVGLVSAVINVQLILAQRNDLPFLCTINVCLGMVM